MHATVGTILAYFNYHVYIVFVVVFSDVRYDIFYILPIMIIAHQIYHDMIIIMYSREQKNLTFCNHDYLVIRRSL